MDNEATHDNAIDNDAFAWVVRLDSGLSAGQQEALDAWLRRDIRHVGAFARAQAVLDQGVRAKALGPNFKSDALLGGGLLSPPSASDVLARRWSRRSVLGASGAAVATSLAAILVAVNQPASATTYSTNVGETRRVPLPDGSALSLNTATEVQVIFSRTARTITLVGGEMFLDMVRGSEHPLLVKSGAFTLNSFDCQLSLCRLAHQPDKLVVAEGTVNVACRDGASLIAGPRTCVTVPPNGPPQLEHLSEAATNRELLWRDGLVAFDGEPLTSAVASFRRYSNIPLYITDKDLSQRTITGVFSTSDPVGFANAVALALDCKIRVEHDGIYLASSV